MSKKIRADFIVGQCWISDAELNLGIGLIQSSELRQLKVFFPLCNEYRTYAKQTAPLTRLIFHLGDKLKTLSGEKIQISAVDNQQGLFTYTGYTEQKKCVVISEAQINPVIQLNKAAQRIANAQVDPSLWFDLRHKTLSQQNQLTENKLIALTASRISLIDHQLYVANHVASRYAPRVLLADEVGLGKTIEAGMILQHQLYTEKVKRVLIVVPDSLIHQWLIEMQRRFNLNFSLFDEQRCLAEEQSSGMDNVFFTEQLVLCCLSFLTQSPRRMLQALEGQWDMLIVDEAHHLHWSAQQSSLQYQCIEQLAKLTKAVLLLTATPEQLGKESHFARLRLLDPDRFTNYKQFEKEEKLYQSIASLIDKLQAADALATNDIKQIELNYQIALSDQQKQQLLTPTIANNRKNNSTLIITELKKELIDKLLDCHGTGRLLFRNTRAVVQGFPKRHQIGYALDLPLAYQQCLLEIQQSSVDEPQLLLSLEMLYLTEQQSLKNNQQNREVPTWLDFDGRINWLGKLSEKLSTHKILIICAYAQTAQQLNLLLKHRFGIHSAVFHEGLNLVERDRAAAYFADEEAGCQVLVCSEIGSEGRNFQFSHHLVLFDLPINPDLLEQRIGRLDRIGQAHDIVLHIPYFKNSPTQLMYFWYQQGLNAFESLCPAAAQIFKQFNPLLIDLLHQNDSSDSAAIVERKKFIETTLQLATQLNKKLQQGRDRLLELNSCRRVDASNLVQQSQKNDQNSALESYLEQAFEVLGVDSEPDKKNSVIIHPGDKMQLAISGLEDEGLTYTCDRATALSNEDMQFLNWVHPLVADVMDQILSSGLGNTAMVMIPSTELTDQNIEQGSFLLESIFIVESKSAHIQHMFALLTEMNKMEMPHHIMQSVADEKIENIDNETIKNILDVYKDELKVMINYAQTLADKNSKQLIKKLFTHKLNHLNQEKNRLEDLQKINPTVREEEISYFKQQIKLLQNNKEQITVRLDALRLIVVT